MSTFLKDVRYYKFLFSRQKEELDILLLKMLPAVGQVGYLGYPDVEGMTVILFVESVNEKKLPVISVNKGCCNHQAIS